MTVTLELGKSAIILTGDKLSYHMDFSQVALQYGLDLDSKLFSISAVAMSLATLAVLDGHRALALLKACFSNLTHHFEKSTLLRFSLHPELYQSGWSDYVMRTCALQFDEHSQCMLSAKRAFAQIAV